MDDTAVPRRHILKRFGPAQVDALGVSHEIQQPPNRGDEQLHAALALQVRLEFDNKLFKSLPYYAILLY